jgi:hypothetical protein
MKRFYPIILSFLVLVLVFYSSCSKSPTTPEKPNTPTVQSITVTSSSDMLYIGISETFTASAIASDGSSIAVVGGIWGSDNPSVATVDASGRVTIVGSGTASIYVDYKGCRGSKVIRGLPNYQGTWSGSYYIVSCSSSGKFSRLGLCDSMTVNSVWPTNFNLIQDRDRVQGRFSLGVLSADTSGPVQTDGQLQMSGTIREGIFTIEVTWCLESTTVGRITGSLSEVWWATGYSGNARTAANIRDLNRTSTMIMAPAPAGPWLMNPTLEDVIRALIEP